MHVVPGIVYLALGCQGRAEQLPCLWCYMAASSLLVSRYVCPVTAELTINITREIPIKIETIPGNSRIRRLRDKPEASLVDVLKHKRGVISAKTPTRIFEWVRVTVEHSTSLGMAELGKIVVISMDDDRAFADEGIADVSAVKTIGRLSTDALGKSESEETDTSHQKQDKTDKPHLLSPCPLSFRAPKACDK